MNVVGAIAPQLERAEIGRAKAKPTESLDAYDYYLRAQANLHHGTRAATDAALPLLHQAIALDRNFAPGYALASWCHLWRKTNSWLKERETEIAEGMRLARLAVELGRDDARVLARAGSAIANLSGDLGTGISLLDRAKMLNPNLAAAWFINGFLRTWNGDCDSAIAHFTQAMRLSPLDPEMYRMQTGMAAAHLFAGHFDEASAWATKAYRDLPSFLLVVAVSAASHALCGRVDEAQQAIHLLRMLDPALRVSTLQDRWPIRRSQHLAIFAEGLKKAGLPGH